MASSLSSQSNVLTWERVNSILKDHTPMLLQMIKTDSMFAALLVQYDVITAGESVDMRGIELPSKAKQYLFDIIKSKLEYFISFCIVLHKEMKREDIVCDMFHLKIFHLERQKTEIQERRKKEKEETKRLEEQEKEKQVKRKREEEEEEKRLEEPEKEKEAQQTNESSPNGASNCTAVYKKLTYSDVVGLLTEHKNDFIKQFEPDDGVIAELKKAKVITPDTEDELKAAGITPDEKKRIILETMGKRGIRVFLDFCIVLDLDGIEQEHLVTDVLHLDLDEIRKQRDEYDRTVNDTTAYKPLEQRDVEKLLIDHKTAFYDRFEPTDRVIAELRKFRAIRAETENSLKAAAITPNQKINKILDTVKNKGIKAFLTFCWVLCQDNILQEHVVTEVLGLNIGNIKKQRGT